MPDTPVNTGSPKTAAAPTVDSFGFEVEQKPAGDPAATDDGKKQDGSATPAAGDPEKGTTPDDGSAKVDKEQAQRRFAGKYDTAEALEAGYGNLFSQNMTVQKDNKALREKAATLEARIKELEVGQKPAGTTPDQAQSEHQAKLDAAKKVLVEVMGDDDAASKMLSALTDAFGQPVTQQPVEDKETRQILDELKRKELEREFYEIRPDAKTPEVQDMVNTILGEMNEKGEDAMFHMGLLADAAKGRLLPTLIDMGVTAELARREKEAHDKLHATNLVSDGTAGGRGGGVGIDPKAERANKAFFGDQG